MNKTIQEFYSANYSTWLILGAMLMFFGFVAVSLYGTFHFFLAGVCLVIMGAHGYSLHRKTVYESSWRSIDDFEDDNEEENYSQND